MSKREQALSIEPKNEIHFKGPYNRVVTEYFRLSNPTDRPIAFKVKTTAPKRYCVRPNNGTIAPGKQVQVAVMLQPLGSGEQPSALEKNKHKFMIQSVFVATETGNADDLFKSVPADEIMDSKFRCVFDDPATAALSTTNATQAPLKNAHGSDSETDIQGGDKLLHSGDTYSSGIAYNSAVTNNNNSDDVSSSLATAPDSSLLNGSDDDHYGGASTGGFSTSLASTAPTVVESSTTAVSGDVKRLLEENRELKQKLAELRAGGQAYNRFGGQSSQSQQSSQKPSSSSSAVAQASSQQQSLLDQPLSPQVIFTVLISLLIGFILGKLELF